MEKTEYRKDILKKYGASDDDAGILLDYNENSFNFDNLNGIGKFPVESEPFSVTWKSYASESAGKCLFEYLKGKLIQFNFPVEEGISRKESYIDATLNGNPLSGAESPGLLLEKPADLKLLIHKTVSGEIPVLLPGNRNDFISIVRALNHKNEPVKIPGSMGASFVSGYNNWDRIRAYRTKWLEENPSGNWDDEFGNIIPKKHLYQDKFIIVSDGPYSGVESGSLGLSEETWKDYSVKIRMEHESAHYFTKRCLLSIKTNLLDELIADYMGITAVLGRFDSRWFLFFLGLENFPEYRRGGRFENYIGKDVFTETAACIMRELVFDAADNLEKADALYPDRSPGSRCKFLLCLTHFTMEELASKNCLELFHYRMDEIENKYYKYFLP
jgi:hypothetical protein